MKPKTKLQKKVMKLSVKLDPVSDADKRWANGILFDNYFVECRNRYNCLECGHKWNSDDAKLSKYILPTTCPECQVRNLNHIDHWDSDESKYEYWAIIDVIEGFQVVRMFFAEKYMKRKQPAQYFHREVMQHFIREDGKMESLTMRTGSLGQRYYDSWSTGSELEPRTDSYNHRLRCGIRPYKIRPGRNTLPEIRRNGYKGYFKGEAPHQFFSSILKYPQAETLLKAGQLALFKECVGGSEMNQDIVRYWDSICIAMRNDYIVEDAHDWFDYLGMLDEFGKDLNNPHYVCPDDFHGQHQRYVKKRRIKRKAEAKRKRRMKIQKAQQEYQRLKAKFFGLHIVARDITIVPMKSVQEVIDLGDRLHHCLGLSYAKKENSLILGAYRDGEPVEAIEIDLVGMRIVQARGLQNKATDYHQKIVSAVREKLPAIARIKNRNTKADQLAA